MGLDIEKLGLNGRHETPYPFSPAYVLMDRWASLVGPGEGSNFRLLDLRKKARLLGTCLQSRHKKLLDDAEALLYCDPESDRQSALSLS
jgi:hypothetical protein